MRIKMNRKLILVFVICIAVVLISKGTKAMFTDKDVVTGNSISVGSLNQQTPKPQQVVIPPEAPAPVPIPPPVTQEPEFSQEQLSYPVGR